MQTRHPRHGKPLLALAILLILVSGLGRSAAAILTYTTEATFTNALQAGFYYESFGTTSQADTTFSFTGPNPTTGPFSYVLSATETPSFGVAIFPTDFTVDSTSQGFAASPYHSSVNLVIDFSGGNVTAVGGYFFQTDANGLVVPASQIVATLNDGSFVNVPTTSSSSVGFAGFTSDGPAITRLTLSGNNYATVDNLYVGAAVPVPEPTASLLAGFLGLWFAGRRLLKSARHGRA